MASNFEIEIRKYDPPGRCVFCRRKLTLHPLTDEHIVPLFLSGGLEIVRGACRRCANWSNKYYESSASRTSFLAYRLHMGLNRRRKDEKKLLPAAVGNQTMASADAFAIDIDPATRLPLFSLIVFPPPTGLANPKTVPDSIRIAFANLSDQEVECEASIVPKRTRSRTIHVIRTYVKHLNLTLQDEHDVQGFLLQIAKIGYCYAVAERGLEAFDGTEFRRLLRGRRTDAATFVGSPTEDGEPLPTTPFLHKIYLHERDGKLIAHVQLFAFKATRPYEVILGPLRRLGTGFVWR